MRTSDRARPAQIHAVNYIGTLNLLQALQETGCDAFVQAGSSSEYGYNCAGPAESAALEPNSNYAVSKVATSYLLQYYGRVKSFPCTHLRLYSIYGPWEERDRLVARLISFGIQGRYPPLGNAETTRDFVYVDDCTRAFVRAAALTCRSAPGQVFNIATGVKTSLRDIAAERWRCTENPWNAIFRFDAQSQLGSSRLVWRSQIGARKARVDPPARFTRRPFAHC